MKNSELSDEEKAEQLEMLKKEGLDARIRNLIQPTCNIFELVKLGMSINKKDIEHAEKCIATIFFLTSKFRRPK